MFDLSADSRLLAEYLRHFGIDPTGDRRRLLQLAIVNFSSLPYENLTKIIKHTQLDSAERSRRSPTEVLQDHIRLGAGGTCFSLTATLLQLVRSLGWRAHPILADRRYGPDTHCALLVWIDDCPHLVDPGYLITDPIPLEPPQTRTIFTRFNQLRLEPLTADRWDLSTIESPALTSTGATEPSESPYVLGTHSAAKDPDEPPSCPLSPGRGEERQSEQANRSRLLDSATARPHPPGIKYRLTFKTQPADPGQFLRAWNASFAWDMMQYPLLTRVAGDRQLYLHGGRLQIRSHEQIQRVQLSHDQLVVQISDHFGIDSRVVGRALAALKR